MTAIKIYRDKEVHTCLDILGVVCIGNLPRLHRLSQLRPQGSQLLLELLQGGCGAAMAYILEASHNVLCNDVLHRFHTAALNLSHQC